MRKSWLLCVLLGTLAWGQAAPSAPPPSQPARAPSPNDAQTPAPAPPDTSASVPATAAVITINGVCSAPTKAVADKGTTAKSGTAEKTADTKTPAGECKTVITKAQFERMADNLAPNITAQQKKQLAGVLPRLMAMSNDAKKQGLDKSPQYDERVKFNKMQILAQLLQQDIQDKAAKVSDEEVAKYYKDHGDTFEQYSVDRLFVPRTKQGEPEAEAKEEDEKGENVSEEAQKAKEATEKAKADEGEQAMTKLAADLRGRAAAGEDFVKLQKEAFEAAGMKIESPTVNLPTVRRTGLPPAHAAVFDLKPGEVSQVISDSGGHYIYKLNSKTQMTLDQAKNEIRTRLQNDNQREMMDKINNSFKVETNEAYFGPGGAAMPPRLPRAKPGMPQATPQSQPQTPPAAQPPAANPN
jgi:hypothetical protein